VPFTSPAHAAGARARRAGDGACDPRGCRDVIVCGDVKVDEKGEWACLTAIEGSANAAIGPRSVESGMQRSRKEMMTALMLHALLKRSKGRGGAVVVALPYLTQLQR
jgi:hypothetical protein